MLPAQATTVDEETLGMNSFLALAAHSEAATAGFDLFCTGRSHPVLESFDDAVVCTFILSERSYQSYLASEGCPELFYNQISPTLLSNIPIQVGLELSSEITALLPFADDVLCQNKITLSAAQRRLLRMEALNDDPVEGPCSQVWKVIVRLLLQVIANKRSKFSTATVDDLKVAVKKTLFWLSGENALRVYLEQVNALDQSISICQNLPDGSTSGKMLCQLLTSRILLKSLSMPMLTHSMAGLCLSNSTSEFTTA
jgi:hypothetical protein